jgi:TetR/AcrR family transcriptional regulator, transcriptional repressor for nem operon
MKTNSKNRILEVGAGIIHLKGFHNTGIQEILQAAGVPKGSFYNYFSNKEDFGLQLIDYFMGFFSSISEPILENPAFSPLEKIKKILELFMDLFQSKDFAYGCPIGNLAQEMGDLSPVFREKLKSALENMVDTYAGMLAEARIRGEISRNLDVRKAAYFLVSSWHGALIHMKAVKSLEPLENHKQFIFEYVLKP